MTARAEKSRDGRAGADAIDAATLRRRRAEFRRTSPGQRLEEALELSRFAKELREGFLRASR